ncbi:MAG TPA: cation-translocating P-type ATPase, partial [Phototrophicaceae bacterium]|nr:cation-translocating P-type ATPase [Phototrophicaceae bacterium]
RMVMLTTRIETQTAPDAAEWHVLAAARAADILAVNLDSGLTAAQVQERLKRYGPNELVEGPLKNPLAILWEQLTNPLVLLLIFAAVISALLGKTDSVIAISAIVILNAVLGVVQEYRAEQAMAALKKMAAPLVRVRRDGRMVDIAAREIVPGDMVLLEAGSVIPADARVLESANLRVQEAALTGESLPIEKITAALTNPEAALGDRYNMLYMGTAVTYGRGTALVVETGMKTQLGRIAELIQTVESEPTPLQRRMGEVGRVLLVAAVVVMVLAFLVGLLVGEPLQEVLLNAVAIAVAVVPEGLPAVVTIALALGAQRMLKRRALIRKLPAVEGLGSVTTICSDKTGTLTENKMTVTLVDVAGKTSTIDDVIRRGMPALISANGSSPGEEVAHALLLAGDALCNDVVLEVDKDHPAGYRAVGDPTEGALVVAAAQFGLWKTHLDAVLPRVGEVPFSSERKRMTTVHQLDEQETPEDGARYIVELMQAKHAGYIAFTKGAVDSLLHVCDRVWLDGQIERLTPEWRTRIEAANNRMAQDGLRVLGMAFTRLLELPVNWEPETVEHHLVFVGMVGIIDPPRSEVKEAVRICRQAGIRPVMITGDHPLTAFKIARDLGIARAEDRVLTGHDLSQMSQTELEAEVEQVSVYARVSPEHKLNIVRALQTRGHITAMTGDGVNDAPALKRADIGVAMGITGTAVSKEASDMVILDDNFATIVSAVEEGRTIYDNVRRFVKYLLASNSGELFVLLMTQFVSLMTIPLTTLQILWMNLITDGIPALALGVEKGEQGVMLRAPYAPTESIFGRGMARHILIVGLLLGVTGLLLGIWSFNQYLSEATPIAAELGLTMEQLVEAQRVNDLDLNDPVAVAIRAEGLGITSEQLTQALVRERAMNYNAFTWNTMVFMFLTIAQMGHALANRSHRESTFKIGFLGNRFLVIAVVLTIFLQLVAVYLPFFNHIFNTTPLTLTQLAICLVLSTIVFWGVEVEKLFIRRGVFNG